MDKEEIWKWNRKYDDENPWWIETEKRLGNKFRTARTLTKADLREIVEWKFKELAGRRKRILKLINENDEIIVQQTCTCVFNLTHKEDRLRIDKLTSLKGVGPSLASTILTFYDPTNYGIHDIHVWREFFGPEPSTIFTGSDSYLKLLSELRKIAGQYGIEARAVEKAYFMKNYQPEKKEEKPKSKDEGYLINTWSGESSFSYEGSVEGGTTIMYGSKPFKMNVSTSKYQDLLRHFACKTVECGTSRTATPVGSLGEWLKENVSKTALASYVGAILVNEGYANKRGSRIEFL